VIVPTLLTVAFYEGHSKASNGYFFQKKCRANRRNHFDIAAGQDWWKQAVGSENIFWDFPP
jgi:hypothetical protein